MVAAQAFTAEPKASVHAALGSISGKLVVVIDDDALVLDSTGGDPRLGLRCVTAASAHAALVGLAERDRTPDLIISDYRLSDGKTASKRSKSSAKRSTCRYPPFSSAATRPPNGGEARASGYHLLHKPVRPRALRAMLGRLLKKHDLADAIP